MQKLLNGASRMMQTLKLQVLLMRLFRRIKTAYANSFSVNHDLRSPFSLMGAYAQKTNLVSFGGFSHVLQITKPRNLTQISKRIVQLIAVNVVYMTFGHVARHIKPRQSMRQSFNVMHGNRNVSRALSSASRFSDKIRSVMVFSPSKNAGLHVVIQRFAQMFNGNVGCNSHDIQFTIKAA